MRLMCLVLVLAAALSAGAGWGEEATVKTDSTNKVVLADRNNDGRFDGIDVYDSDSRPIRRGFDYNNDGVMDTWESYDPNTGLPDVTQSDAAGTLR